MHGNIYARPPEGWGRYWAFVMLCAACLLALAGCGSPPVRPVLQPAPPAPVIARVAIPVACVIEQVPMPAYPGELVQAGDDIFVLARLVTADRRVRIAERDRLRAANQSPCPGASKP